MVDDDCSISRIAGIDFEDGKGMLKSVFKGRDAVLGEARARSSTMRRHKRKRLACVSEQLSQPARTAWVNPVEPYNRPGIFRLRVLDKGRAEDETRDQEQDRNGHFVFAQKQPE